MSASLVRTFELDQRLPGGFHMPTRMSVLPLHDGTLALISPIPIDDALAAQLSALGEVRYLIAPNLQHHLYLAAASERYPHAAVLAPTGLRKKRPHLRIDATLDQSLPGPVAQALSLVRIEGAPAMDEYAFFHRQTRCLVLTDLLFHIREPRGFVAHLVLWLVGCYRRLAPSRVWRLLVRDRAAFSASLHALLALPLQSVVFAHGEPLCADARTRLAEALQPWCKAPLALPVQEPPRMPPGGGRPLGQPPTGRTRAATGR